MAVYVCVGALAAFGLLCVLWTVYGLCCGKPEGMLLIVSKGESGLIRRCLWLREMGLLRCPMVLLESGRNPPEAAWLARHGIEVPGLLEKTDGKMTGERSNGAGTGDPSGCHQRGGLSEL